MAEERGYWEESERSWSEDSVWYSNTPTPAVRQTFFYIQEVGYFRAFPSYYTERANLDSYLIFHTLSGNGILKIFGNTYQLTPGTTVMIPCTAHHYYACGDCEEWEFLWFHFNGPCALGYYQQFEESGFRVCADQDCEFTEKTMRKILELSLEKTTRSEILISGLIGELLTHLLIMNSDTNSSRGQMPDYIKKMLKMIEKRFREPLSLDDFSAELGVSKYHLAREFKRYVGTTPNEYLTLTRLNYAKELLKYSSLSVEETAYACGFHYLSYFAKQFYRHEELTPLQFRKKWER